MKNKLLALSLSLALCGCGTDNPHPIATTPVKPKAEAKVVVIPLAYASADVTSIKVPDEDIYLADANDINDVFLSTSSQPNLWLEWASQGKHHFSEDSQSLNWKTSALTIPTTQCGEGEGRYYPLKQILTQITFSDDEMATIRSADQIIVLGYGNKNCRFNDSYVNTSPTRIGSDNINHVVYVDLDAAPMKRESMHYLDGDYSGHTADLQDVTLLNAQKTFIHEYLHTFKIGHSNAGKRCSWEMINEGVCRLNDIFNQDEIAGGDYADAYDIMGNRQYAYGLNAIHRMKLGWLPPAEELVIDGSAKTLSSVNEADIEGYKIIKLNYKGKNIYFSNYYQHENNQGFDRILQSDYELFEKYSGRYDHNEKIMARNLDGVMLHYELYNSYYALWSTRLISQSGQPDAYGYISFENAAFTDGRYRLDGGLFITVTKLADGQFELLLTSS